MELDMVRGSQQKFTFQGTSETYDQKINRPTKWKEQTTEIYKVFNLNFHPGYKNPLECDSALMFTYKPWNKWLFSNFDPSFPTFYQYKNFKSFNISWKEKKAI